MEGRGTGGEDRRIGGLEEGRVRGKEGGRVKRVEGWRWRWRWEKGRCHPIGRIGATSSTPISPTPISPTNNELVPFRLLN